MVLEGVWRPALLVDQLEEGEDRVAWQGGCVCRHGEIIKSQSRKRGWLLGLGPRKGTRGDCYCVGCLPHAEVHCASASVVPEQPFEAGSASDFHFSRLFTIRCAGPAAARALP